MRVLLQPLFCLLAVIKLSPSEFSSSAHCVMDLGNILLKDLCVLNNEPEYLFFPFLGVKTIKLSLVRRISLPAIITV